MFAPAFVPYWDGAEVAGIFVPAFGTALLLVPAANPTLVPPIARASTEALVRISLLIFHLRSGALTCAALLLPTPFGDGTFPAAGMTQDDAG